MSDNDSVIVLTLPDGAELELPSGSTAFDAAKAIGPGLAKAVVGAEIDGRIIDLREPLTGGGNFRLFTSKNAESGDFVRHSAEHVLADAVKRLWRGLIPRRFGVGDDFVRFFAGFLERRPRHLENL